MPVLHFRIWIFVQGRRPLSVFPARVVFVEWRVGASAGMPLIVCPREVACTIDPVDLLSIGMHAEPVFVSEERLSIDVGLVCKQVEVVFPKRWVGVHKPPVETHARHSKVFPLGQLLKRGRLHLFGGSGSVVLFGGFDAWVEQPVRIHIPLLLDEGRRVLMNDFVVESLRVFIVGRGQKKNLMGFAVLIGASVLHRMSDRAGTSLTNHLQVVQARQSGPDPISWVDYGLSDCQSRAIRGDGA